MIFIFYLYFQLNFTKIYILKLIDTLTVTVEFW